ncbi:MAG: hypothetical protein GEU74_03195 [Nitriliruptorales bacterium]|nr:hypothetical protein [Nitriliruptorales bacterium]
MTTGGRPQIAAYVVAALLAAGCTDDASVDGRSTEPAIQHAVTVAPEAGELRIRLEESFGLHAHLVAEADRTSGRAGRAAAAALEQSAEEVVRAVADAADGGDAATARLEQTWATYAAGVEGSPSRRSDRQRARAARRLAAALSQVTDRLEQQGVERLLRAPLDKLARHARSFAQRDHEQAYALEREAYAEMVTLGGAVAAGVAEDDPRRFPGPRSTGALELRSALRQILGEHALLTATATRRGMTASREFASATAALNGNTADLGNALRSFYRDAPAFEAQWRDRISVLAEYAAAVGDDRNRAARRARRQTRHEHRRIGGILERLSAGEVAEVDGVRAVRQLDTALLHQIDAFGGERFEQAERNKVQAYEAALELADLIAAAAAEQKPEDFPTE